MNQYKNIRVNCSPPLSVLCYSFALNKNKSILKARFAKIF